MSDRRRYRRILEHVLFWVLHWLVLSTYGGLYDLDFGTTALYNLSDLPITILFTYTFIYGILPLYFRRRVGAFALCTVATLVASVLLKRLLTQHVQFPWLYTGSDYTFDFFNWYRIMGHSVEFMATAGLVAGLKYFRDWQRTRDRVEALSAEKRAAELSFLRAQVHPHFLFNTLNSIYYEVLRKTDAAPDLIIRLCDILRFTLYQCKDPLIPVAREVELIQNYVALERCRYGDRLTVSLDVEGDTQPMVPPLICFSLVENAFKHGTSENKDHSHIRIRLQVGGDRLHMEVQNPLAEAYQPDVLGASKGIGLHNITQQLDLLFGEGYRLHGEAQDGQYVSILDIPLQPRP